MPFERQGNGSPAEAGLGPRLAAPLVLVDHQVLRTPPALRANAYAERCGVRSPEPGALARLRDRLAARPVAVEPVVDEWFNR